MCILLNIHTASTCASKKGSFIIQQIHLTCLRTVFSSFTMICDWKIKRIIFGSLSICMSLAFMCLRGEWLYEEINIFQPLAFDDASESLYLSQSCILFYLSHFSKPENCLLIQIDRCWRLLWIGCINFRSKLAFSKFEVEVLEGIC